MDNKDYWDDIDVGKFDLNHSENFFKEKHFKHEKKELLHNSSEVWAKENDQNECNTSINPNDVNEDQQLLLNLKKFQITAIEVPPNNVNQMKNQNITQNSNTNIRIASITETGSKETTLSPSIPTKKTTAKSASSKTHKVYNYADYYVKKKQILLDQINAEEKQQRKFHSKPAPNFKLIHQAADIKLDELKKLPTCPLTPKVLRKTQEQQHKKKLEMQNYLQKIEPPAFKSAEPTVLRKLPFIPKKEKHEIMLAPFDLKLTVRSELRKIYDNKYVKYLEEKRIKEAEEKRLEEEKIIKTIRKAAEFKANPNPFA